MAEVVSKAGVRKEPGYLYFVDKNGSVCRAPMSRAGRTKGSMKKEVVSKTGVKKEAGYLYFVDGKGNVCRAKMARGRKSGSKKKAVKRKVAARSRSAKKKRR